MKRILITGANSYVGGAVEKRLTAAGHAVTVLDMIGDAWRAFDFSGYDCVFHVAGIAHDIGKKKDAALYYKVNTELAIETAEKAYAANVPQFIFMSSMLVYNGVKKRHITADTRPKIKGCYGDSKRRADLALQAMNGDTFKVAILRPPMIFGAGCKGNFPRLVRLAVKAPFFPKMKNYRSMLHIDNLCEFIRLLVEEGSGGLFFPQNPDYFNTSALVAEIAALKGKRLRQSRLWNPAVWLAYPFLSAARKLFGNLTYDKHMSAHFNGAYQIAGNAESVKRSVEP
ncbi:UDP-glucose 4-epimerase [Clostridia bacterium]|nr:UDP-glucose 4-epimerase [Clostridia bacterium]